jgi:hypothetical protein
MKSRARKTTQNTNQEKDMKYRRNTEKFVENILSRKGKIGGKTKAMQSSDGMALRWRRENNAIIHFLKDFALKEGGFSNPPFNAIQWRSRQVGTALL